ncbi:unnamed protein product [Phytophthora lilii]|uniref:Unnamed protein product n=1 Tax=Phytophthora lilii TaxID=2077276 RepID=A0A9W6WVG5_9STRA|nr:unnamed protein product [Phytophthora lilii]
MAIETSEASDQPLTPHGDYGSTAGQDDQIVVQPFQRKLKRFKKDGTPYKPRKGWAPYRSVPNERAAAFNLQLDVQNFQQEIHNLTALRDILNNKTMLQRHSPEGSWMRVVKEYFRVFRTGSALAQSDGKTPVNHEDQLAFLRSIVDEQIEVGNGLYGPDVMMDQMLKYSTFIRWISLKMHSFNIVEAEDSVVIKAHATLRFQVLRETIKMVFPHIMGDECLVSQLVGREVELYMGITFYFNADGKCSRLDVDTDFVGAFTKIIKDPEVVNVLLGRALIAENSMLGLIDMPWESEADEDKPAHTGFVARTLNDLARTSSAITASQAFPVPLHEDIHRFCLRVVDDYFLAFVNGYLADDNVELAAVFQRDFLQHRFALKTVQGGQGGNYKISEYTAERWRSLSSSFSVMGFQQTSVESVEVHHHLGLCAISSSARYMLRVTPATMLSVFPHVMPHAQLSGTIVGKVLDVPSRIYFSVEVVSGRICLIEERMEFLVAMTSILPSKHELEFVMSGAKLVLGGVQVPGHLSNKIEKR